MKVLRALLACFVLAMSAFSQDDFRLKGKFYFDDSDEKIIAYEMLGDGEKLLLIGEHYIQILNVKENHVVLSLRHAIENLTAANFGGISPDKTKLVVRGFIQPGSRKHLPKILIPAKVYDIETGKLLAALDNGGNSARSARWSKNSETLAAYGEVNHGDSSDETRISFYDGKTLDYRVAIAATNVTWEYLSQDGANLLTASGPKRDVLGIDYVSQKAEKIDVWNTATGKIEKSFSVGGDYFTRTGKLAVSPDGNFLALILKSRKNDADDKMPVWKINDGENPKYIVAANPKIADSVLSYSPDGKLVALDAGSDAQIYELETGRKKFELPNFEVPDFWLNDNKIALYNKINKIQLVDIPAKRLILDEKVVYETEDRGTGSYSTDSNGALKEETETVVTDYTKIVPQPSGRLFVTFSNYSAKIYDAPGGRLLQTLVAPLPKPPPKKSLLEKILRLPRFKVRDLNLVSEAVWSPDGKLILIKSGDGTSISIWETNIK